MKKTRFKTASAYNHKAEPIATWSRDVVILGVILGVSAFYLTGSLLFTAEPRPVGQCGGRINFISYYSSLSVTLPLIQQRPSLSCVFLDCFFVSRSTVHPSALCARSNSRT